ncbi:RNA deprotection pyrophosphohydrolase [Neobacillus mesonae]|uniref:RNA deprotection pyrophosphohydrolase n=2 Tax=Neobacillus mesonae TaxID=1193713 RepID=UPI0033056EF7
MMKQFLDDHGNKVELAFSKNAFAEEARHVLVLCQYDGSWLLTKHKKRGLEFPGGKREAGETIEDAARREAFEETGAAFDQLEYIAEYRVTEEKGSFVKAVFWGRVKNMEKSDSYFETNGPVLVDGDLLHLRFGPEYSFIMKDQVVQECIKYIQQQQKE